MAGASDPLEDMLFNEVDEKAVSDLVGSLESQLGDRKTPGASFTDGKRDPASTTATHFSGKDRELPGSVEPQQGQQRAGLPGEHRATEPLSAKSTSSSGTNPTGTAPAISPAETLRTAGSTPGQSLNGSPAAPPAAGTSSVINTVSPGGSTLSPGVPTVTAPMTSQPDFPGHPQASVVAPGGPLQRLPGPVTQNGVDPKGAPVVVQGGPSSQVLNHSAPPPATKVLLPSQPASGSSVILTGTPPPPAQSPIGQIQTGTSPASGGVKSAVNGVASPTVAPLRPPGAPVVATSVQQQRPGLVAPPTRAAAPQPPLAVRPQQQTTIQLPPGFTMPPGMVLVRTETGQLVMVPQQILAQAQAKTQQGQTVANITQRPTTPTAGAAIRVSTASPAPQTVRLATPAHTRMVQSPPTTTVQKAITVTPGGAALSVKMAPPQKTQTVITAGGTPVAKPTGVPPTPLTSTPPTATTPAANRVTVVSQEMQENVKKCKNFLATLIKLASHNSPSPDTSKNVKALVQDLLVSHIV
ncbi:transcription initiation factor TFIID subunit 4-like, partial [Cheilinus undulatus]|uniref:transcription initiation factor TFIID subunit 4-like n=1 Tax=Cheilinus undulatus TaxID=241271 RepID=UPI001BD65176